MRKARNMPIDKKRFKEVLDRIGLRQADVDDILGLKRLAITKAMYYGNANPRIIDALEKRFGISYDDIRPITDEIKMDGSTPMRQGFVKKNDVEPFSDPVETPKPRNLVNIQVDTDVISEAVKEGMKQFWRECGNDILKAFEDVIFTGNYDARRKYTSQDLTYDLHKCWNTDKGYADLPEVQATLHRKR